MVQTFHGMVQIMSNRIERMGESPGAKQAGPRGIIAFDLDGTVWANRFNSRVTPRVEAAFAAAHDTGYALTISTGRPLIELSDELLGASWLDWAICSSGSVIYRVKPYPEGLGVSSVNNIDDLRHAVPIESHTLDFEQIQGIMSLTASNVASYWADTPAGYFVEDEKMPEHLQRHVIAADHAVAQRAHHIDVLRRPPEHLLRLAPDANDPIGHLVDRHDRGLFEDDPPPLYIYQYRCRTEVNRNIPTHRTSFRYIIS